MKKLLTASVAFALLLTSCTSPTDLGIIGGADGPTVTVVGKPSETAAESATFAAGTTAEVASASTTDPTAESAAETAPSMPDDSGFTALEGDLEFYRFDGGNASVVWSDKSAWVFDYVLDEVIPVFDHEKALADVDFRGEGAQYFADYTLTPDFRENSDYELCITFTVSSATRDASYEAYCYYTLNSPTGLPRGELRGYYRKSVSYPGSDDPITVTDVGDINELLGDPDGYSYIVRLAEGLCTADKTLIADALGIQAGPLDKWDTVTVADYAITRRDFSSGRIIESLDVYLNITESELTSLPAGRYSVTLNEGAYYPDVAFISLDAPDMQGTLMDPAIEWLLPWIESHGIGYFYAENETHSADRQHSFIDFYLNNCRRNGAEPSLEDFHVFVDETFGSNTLRGRVARESVENHGGHGMTFAQCDIVSHEISGGEHTVTAEYYYDSMNTVPVWRVVYRLEAHENGYRIISARRIYDSGATVMNYGT